MSSSNLVITFLLLVVIFHLSRQEKSNAGSIKKKLAQLCYKNQNNYIKDTNVIKCEIEYDDSCWPETAAGQTVIQPCPFLTFSPKDNISRRCDQEGHWQDVNITSCRRLLPTQPVKTISSTIPPKRDSTTHRERVQQVYLAFSWIAFIVLLFTFIVICVVMSREHEHFNLHKNLILAFILRIITVFIHYYGNLGEHGANETACNVFWMLNRYFTACEITWLLNEAIFVLRMLVYPLATECSFWNYFMLGWGFSGFLTFCAYLPYAQFKLSRISSSCWVTHSQSHHMLVMYIPLTIMLLISFGIAVYVVYILARKMQNSNSSHMNTVKKVAKAMVVLIFFLGIIYLVTFYQPGNNNPYDYLVAVIYPFQGVLVCICCVFVDSKFHKTLKRCWMKWKYGQIEESSPYSVEGGECSRPQSAAENEETGVSRTASAMDPRPSTSPQDPSRGASRRIDKQSSKTSLLSRSSDLTKFRLAKIEPEPAEPLRINVATPDEWCPPTLQAMRAWDESLDSSQNCNESFNGGYVAGSESNLTFSSQWSLTGTQPSTRQMTARTEVESAAMETEKTNNTEPNDKEETDTITSSHDYPENQLSIFSSQELECDHQLSTVDLAKETPSGTADLSMATAGTTDSNPSNPAEPSTNIAGSSLSLRNELSTEAAGSSFSNDAQHQNAKPEDQAPKRSRGKAIWKKAQRLALKRRRSRQGSGMVQSTENGSLQLEQKQQGIYKQPDEYRLAWISSLLKEQNSPESKETDA